MQTIKLWLKRLLLRLAIHALSMITAALAALFALLPFLHLLKWLFGPLPDTDGLPNPIDGWWMWLIILAWLVLFWKTEPLLNRWLLDHFGLGRKAGLKSNRNEQQKNCKLCTQKH